MKILITGPESTGKTTISKFIASQFEGIYISEFAREYLEKNGPSYTEEDLVFFTKETINRYNNEPLNKIQIYDTSLIDIVVWSLFKYGRCDPWIIEQTGKLHFDLILIATPEVNWTADPLRENENNREALYDLFIKNMKELNLDFTVLFADRNEREEQVKEIIDNMLKEVKKLKEL